MTISPADILQFKKESAFIPSNNILPITSYIQIAFTPEGYTLTRSNMHMFYVKNFSGITLDEVCTLLLEDTILYNFAAQSKGDIKIVREGENIILTCGKMRAAKSYTDPNDFPAIAFPDGQPFNLDAGLLAIADNFIVHNDLPMIQNHIFIGNGHMCASDGFIGFAHDINPSIPPTVLRKETSAGIPEKTVVPYYPGGNFHIIGVTNGRMGIIGPEKKYQDIYPIFKASEQPDFILDKSEIIQFCQYCLGISKEKITTAHLWSDGLKLTLSLDNNPSNDIAIKEIICNCTSSEKFNFNIDFMLRLLRAIPEERVSFYPGNGKYLVRGVGDWVALIMGIAPVNTKI